MKLRAGALSIATLLILGCKARNTERATERANGKNTYSAVVDLTRRLPIGYEICARHPLVLRRAVITATLRLPSKMDIPPNLHRWGGVKAIMFRPGEHQVGFYNLKSERLLYAMVPLSIRNGVPTIKVKLDTHRLPKGQYFLGISGDPFFVYCSVELQ